VAGDSARRGAGITAKFKNMSICGTFLQIAGQVEKHCFGLDDF
jgi:hypothetical protein